MDTVLDIAWEDIEPNMPVRFATPTFVCYGKVVSVDGESLTLAHVPHTQLTIIYAKWYFEQPDDEEEHLVILDSRDNVLKGKLYRNPKVRRNG